MADKDNKWAMFKNYMHNELGITKEDIRTWIQDAVHKEAKDMINDTYSSFKPKDIVQQLMFSNTAYGNTDLKREIKQEIVNVLNKQLVVSFNNGTQ